MEKIQRVKDRCLVCESLNLEPLLFYYSRHLSKLFHRVAICRDCGHIQLYPLLTETTLGQINNRFFGSNYMANDQQNVGDNTKKTSALDQRISSYVRAGFNILDVGAGEAWTLDYFQHKNCHYHAIEFVPRLAALIRERGGEVIGQTIFDDYSEYDGQFDIIIFRHIIEHLLDPKTALIKLRKMLRANGIIYLALPNAQNPAGNVGFKRLQSKGFRTSFIRPVHISYFCEGNVHYLASLAGLKPLATIVEDEIFCLLQPTADDPLSKQNYYNQQKNIFLNSGRESLKTDLIQIAKNIPMTLARRVLGR